MIKLDLGTTAYWLDDVPVLRTEITCNQVSQILLAVLVFTLTLIFWRLI